MRVQNSIPVPPNVIDSSNPLSLLHRKLGKIPSSEGISYRDDSESSSREGRPKVARILQPHVCGTEKEREMEAHYRLEPTEQIHQGHKIQDGDNQNSIVIHSKKSVVHIDRSDRRLLSHSHSPIEQEVSTLRVRGGGVPVPSIMLRNSTSTPGVHRGNACLRGSRPLQINPSTPIHRRLVMRVGHGKSGEGEYSMVARDNQQSGTAGQSNKIRIDPVSKYSLPGCLNRHSQIQGFSVHSESRQLPIPTTAFHERSRKTSVGMVVPLRTHGFIREIGVSLQDENENNSISSKTILDGTATEISHGPSIGSLPINTSMVERPRSSDNGSLSRDDRSRLFSVLGRLDGRLGSNRRPSPDTRHLVIERDGFSHQCTGTRGSCEGLTGVPAISESFYSLRNVRQHNSSVSPESSGGNTLADTMRQDGSSVSVVGTTEHQSDVQICSRPYERDGGHAQPKTTDTKERMVHPSGHSIPSVENMGQTHDRPVCHVTQQQTADLLLAGPRRRRRRGRRPATGLVKTPTVRISSPRPNTSSSEQGSEGPSGSNPDCSLLAKSGVVPGPTSTTSRGSEGITLLGSSTKTTASQGVPSTTTSNGPTRLETVVQSLEDKGFSKESANLIAGGNRATTSRLYQAKWQSFLDWCSGKKINPLTASVYSIADFLTFLFMEKQFSVSTIKGYRSALSRVYHHRGIDLTNDTDISSLIKSMEVQRPITRSQVPKWDLSLVLRHINRAPYEPLRLADIKHLTYKTVFLTLLATAKRVGEVHALSSMMSHSEGWRDITLHFDPTFVAKTQRPSDPSTGLASVTIPALKPTVEEGRPDCNLCVVRALRYYIHRSEEFRAGRKRLFLPIQTGRSKDISKNTLSHWAKNVILEAYAEATDEDAALSLRKASVHELRALSTSLRFHQSHSLSSVMEAACWRGSSTFSTFYLRDLSLTSDGLTSLGPFVAAQEIVGPK